MKRLWIILILLFIACDESKSLDDACNLTPDPGICLAAFPRYYYDDDARQCKEFIWGGCGGVVPFETMEECENGCGV